jgi:hypothetical protein
MNFITRIELTELDDAELAGLFSLISKELALAKPGSFEWQGAMLSLDSIRHEQAKRRRAIRPKPGGPGF